MKKFLLVFVALLAVGSVYAANINLGSFPVGKWLDSNWDAVWEFSSDNIRILDTKGAVIWDFSAKTLNDFKVFMEGTQPGISFSCPEAGRVYRFLKPLTNTDITMEIERDGQPKYTVTLKRQ